MAKSGITLNGKELREEQLSGLSSFEKQVAASETLRGLLVKDGELSKAPLHVKLAVAQVIGLTI